VTVKHALSVEHDSKCVKNSTVYDALILFD